MQSLSGLDAAFIHAETATTPMNVVASLLLAPANNEGSVDAPAVVRRLEQRLVDIPPLRRRLVEVPFGLDQPLWIEDPTFDLDDHVYRMKPSTPEPREALAELAARAAARRLDRSRPLWELWIVEGLEGGRLGLIFRAHHAALDGVSGAAMLVHLFDRGDWNPGEVGDPSDVVDSWSPEPEPSPLQLVTRAMKRTPERTRTSAWAIRESSRSIVRMLSREARDPSKPGNHIPSAEASPFAPRSPFNRAVGSRRKVAYVSSPMANIAAARRAFGGTVTDVVLAACTASLRRYLEDRGQLPEAPLVAAVPISTRDVKHDGLCGNRLSGMLVELPVHIGRPGWQLAKVRSNALRAKHRHAVMGSRTLEALAELGHPVLTSTALSLYSRFKLANRHRPLFNIAISSVPGPPMSLRLCGSTLEALHPHGPLLDGVGLNVTVISYAGSLEIGVLGCADTVPDPRPIADGIAVELERFAKRADRHMESFPALADVG